MFKKNNTNNTNNFLEGINKDLYFLDDIMHIDNNLNDYAIIRLYNLNNKIALLNLLGDDPKYKKLAKVIKNKISSRETLGDAYVLFSKKIDWEFFYGNIVFDRPEKPVNNIKLPKTTYGDIKFKNIKNLNGLPLSNIAIHGNLLMKDLTKLKGLKFKNVKVYGDLKLGRAYNETETFNNNFQRNGSIPEKEIENLDLSGIEVEGNIYINGNQIKKSKIK